MTPAYTYDVNANGNPAPTFSLTTAPAGMSIDPTTGIINWLPTNPGSFNVVVQAANGVLPNATQPFTIQRQRRPRADCCSHPAAAGEVLSGTGAEFFGDGLDDVSTVKGEFFVDGVLGYTDVNNGNHFHFGGAHSLFDTTQFTNGPHTLRMRVTDTRGQTGEQEVQVTIGNGGASWQAQYFKLGDPNSAFTADPNGDGETNLFEYFTGSDPTIADVSRSPVAEIALAEEKEYLALRFVRANWVNDVIPRVEAAGSLFGPWIQIDPADPTYLVSLQENTPSFGLQTITVRDVVPMNAGPRYMRLRLTR